MPSRRAISTGRTPSAFRAAISAARARAVGFRPCISLRPGGADLTSPNHGQHKGMHANGYRTADGTFKSAASGPPIWHTAGTAPDEPRAYENRGSFHRVWNRFLLDGAAFALAAGSRVEPTKANRYRETPPSTQTAPQFAGLRHSETMTTKQGSRHMLTLRSARSTPQHSATRRWPEGENRRARVSQVTGVYDGKRLSGSNQLLGMDCDKRMKVFPGEVLSIFAHNSASPIT
jgi:hypothetical protein